MVIAAAITTSAASAYRIGGAETCMPSIMKHFRRCGPRKEIRSWSAKTKRLCDRRSCDLRPCRAEVVDPVAPFLQHK
jgi:hypothetical protein